MRRLEVCAWRWHTIIAVDHLFQVADFARYTESIAIGTGLAYQSAMDTLQVFGTVKGMRIDTIWAQWTINHVLRVVSGAKLIGGQLLIVAAVLQFSGQTHAITAGDSLHWHTTMVWYTVNLLSWTGNDLHVAIQTLYKLIAIERIKMIAIGILWTTGQCLC